MNGTSVSREEPHPCYRVVHGWGRVGAPGRSLEAFTSSVSVHIPTELLFLQRERRFLILNFSPVLLRCSCNKYSHVLEMNT